MTTKWPKRVALGEHEVDLRAIERGEILPFGFRVYVLQPLGKSKPVKRRKKK